MEKSEDNLLNYDQPLEQLLEQYHRQRSDGREKLVHDLEDNFQKNVESTKSHMLSLNGGFEPVWAKNIIAAVFARKAKAAAEAQVRESNLYRLARYDEDTLDYEVNVHQCYEAEQQAHRPPLVIRSTRSIKRSLSREEPDRER